MSSKYVVFECNMYLLRLDTQYNKVTRIDYVSHFIKDLSILFGIEVH